MVVGVFIGHCIADTYVRCIDQLANDFYTICKYTEEQEIVLQLPGMLEAAL